MTINDQVHVSGSSDYFATGTRNINIPKNQGRMESINENLEDLKKFYETEMEDLNLMSPRRDDSVQDNMREKSLKNILKIMQTLTMK